MKPKLTSTSAVLAALFLAVTAVQASPFPLPSSWDFGSDPGKTNLVDFTTAVGRAAASWNLQTDAARYAGASSSASGVASTRFTGLAGVAGFLVESTASPSFQFWDTVELLALGSAAPTVNTTSTIAFNGVSGRFNNNNGTRRMELLTNGVVAASAGWTLGTSGPFRFVLKGSFVGSSLQLEWKVTNAGSVSQTLTHTIANHLFNSNNTWAGFGGYIAGGTRNLTFDRFSVSPLVLPPTATVLTIR